MKAPLELNKASIVPRSLSVRLIYSESVSQRNSSSTEVEGRTEGKVEHPSQELGCRMSLPGLFKDQFMDPVFNHLQEIFMTRNR